MIRYFVLSSVFFFFSCNANNSKSNALTLMKDGDSLSLRNLLSINCLSTDAIFIDNDTIGIIELSDFNNIREYYAKKYWFAESNSLNSPGYSFEREAVKDSQGLAHLYGGKPFFKTNIGQLDVKYSTISKNLMTEIEKRGYHIAHNKIQRIGDKILFSDSSRSLGFCIYDIKKNSVDILQIEDDFFFITDFFLFDLSNDGTMEIFVFSKGRRPSEDEIGFDVYRIN